MMLVLLLCIVMKIAEISVGRTSPTPPPPPPPPICDRRCRRCRRCSRSRRYGSPTPKRRHRRQSCGDNRCISRKREGVAVMEEPQTPGSDCNSNPATDSIQQDLVGSEFVQDNVEYQWFIDYGYRDGGLHIHPSVLSSLSASYTPKDLVGYYDDLARNLDANLAEIDMESFRTADIHTLLTALPVMCTEPVQHSEFNYQREQYASISGSVMEKLDIGSSISPHTSSQGEDSACSTVDTISICKSSLLFSPVKETPMLPPGGSYSVDSLDCEDMLLTCQTNNKNNYTIAFEGSMTMYSDGSQDFENHDKRKTYEPDAFYDKPKDMKTMLDLSMACSDSKIYTTWSNLKHSSMNKVITRHPSGNNNTIPDISQSAANLTLGGMNKRSQSLPDLSRVREFQRTNIPLNFSVDSAESSNHMQRLYNSGSAMSRSTNAESLDNGENAGTKKLQNLSLVKLFMKQKSMSVEGMSLTLDQSDSVSDNSGWPTSNSGSDSATNTNTQIQRQNDQDNIGDRHVPENDFSINWIRRDVTNNRDVENQKDSLNVLKYAIRNKDDKVEMVSSASVEELSESTSKSGCMSNQRSYDIDPFERKNGWVGLTEKKHPICRTTGIQANAEMEDNAVQTSLIFSALKEKHDPLLQETTINKRPVYVVYPNYTLPDLSFLKIKDTKHNIDNIALKPHTFDRNKMEWKRTVRSGRPFSCNDIDALRQRGFAHIKDWESLTFLLPYEYKKVLHDVPEVSRYININEEVKRPLFCLSPPVRHKTRPISEIIPNTTSSTSSTATQPSSGYRGSSTILTDSSTNQQPLLNNAINPLYLYRYDSVSSETSLNNDKKMHRLNQMRQACPSLPKRSVSLPQDEDESDFNNGRVPPRPPLPRSILRKNKALASKRYSMFEMGDVGEQSEESVEINKRMSLQEPYYMNNDLQLLCRERTIDSEKDVDETEAERYLKEKFTDTTNNANVESENSQHSDDDIKQLEEYLKRSAISSQSSDGDIDNAEVKVRSYVRKFLALRMNKDPLIRNIDMGESQRKTVSFAVHQRKKHLDAKLNNLNIVVNGQSRHDQTTEDKLIELEEKKKMVSSVNRAVDLLLKYWNADSNHSRPNYNERNECAQICLSNLCPALYAIMSDGLKSHLNSTFGPITNSVWQVVEASSQQGPLTKTLNELVQRINGEDVITEGMLKFHAFVFGLLNLRALDAWFAYLCTRESILRKHYSNSSLFVAALANANVREIVDSLLYILNPLAFCPFHLDLLYQYRQLQNSFGNMNNHTVNAMSFRNADLTKKDFDDEETESCGMISSPKKTRPRSCIAYNMDDKCSIMHKGDLQNAKKRFSAINPKTFYALDKLTSEDSEDYTDSLEQSPLNKKASKQPQSKLFNPDTKSSDDNGFSAETKFKKLQEKWELMIGKEGNKGQPAATTPSSPVRTFGVLGKSKIPRLLTSPVKQSNVAANIVGKSSKSHISGISSLKKPANLPTTKTTLKKPTDIKAREITRRTSRVDQDTLGVARTHTARPSSLPYKSHGVMSNDKNLISPHRRAVSTSLPRPTVTTVSRTSVSKHPHKEVRTLTHRIPSDTGHLSFAEGEKLKVILEVDNKWLLCAKDDRRGLVPRACVRSIQT